MQKYTIWNVWWECGNTFKPDYSQVDFLKKKKKKNENGYPILPDPISLEGWKKLTWDHLFTDYLGQQYQLAYRGITKKIQKKQIPYKIISEKQQFFITSSKNGIPTTTKHTRE